MTPEEERRKKLIAEMMVDIEDFERGEQDE